MSRPPKPISDHLWLLQNFGFPVAVFARNIRDTLPRFGIVTGRGLMEGYVHVHIFNQPYIDCYMAGAEPVTAQPQVHLLQPGENPAEVDTHWCFPLVRPRPVTLGHTDKTGRPKRIPALMTVPPTGKN